MTKANHAVSNDVLSVTYETPGETRGGNQYGNRIDRTQSKTEGGGDD